jgi:hypothetical protein
MLINPRTCVGVLSLLYYEAFEHGDLHDDVEHEDVEDPSQRFVD